jgi:prepilin signal peptidase PulO-like enzyme (type II secretory pathway)
MLNLVFAVAGLLAGAVINVLADHLPERRSPQRPRCRHCRFSYRWPDWLAVVRYWRFGGACPNCASPMGRRPLWVEVSTAALFALLPSLIANPLNLAIYSFYVAVLILVIVIDLEYRLILHVVTFPATLFAVLAAFVLTDNSWPSALLGAATGYIFFLLAYWLGKALFGAGALGFGDVTLAMMMGAMLGFHRILFTLVFAILLAAVASLLLLLSGRVKLRSYMAYGPYLALAAIFMIMWGDQVIRLYWRLN